MERIEVPAEVYYKAKDSKKFLKEEDCQRYEFLSEKYMNKDRHAVCEDGEGHDQHFFFAAAKEEIIEICDLSYYLFGYRPRIVDSKLDTWMNWTRGWLWIQYEGPFEYGPCPELCTVSDFIELQKECINNYKSALTVAEQIRNIPVPRN